MNAISRAHKSPLKAARRLLVEQLDATCDELKHPALTDEDIHTIRKDLKRARAILRLLRGGLGSTKYRRLNRAIRNAARPLTPVRDAKVMLQDLELLRKSISAPSQRTILSRLRRSMRDELRRKRAELEDMDLGAVRRRLKVVKKCVANLPGSRLRRADLDTALKVSHKRAHKAYEAARVERSDEALHEWRKQVKYEYGQLELVAPLRTQIIAPLARRARKLSEHLGEDHDLAILHDWIVGRAAEPQSMATGEEVTSLLDTFASRRAKLQGKAFRLGKALYSRNSGTRPRAGLNA